MTGRARRGAEPRTFDVRENGTLRFRPGRRGLALRCQAGTFLVTQEGDPADHVLRSADEFRTASRGLVVAWALAEGTLGARGRLPGPSREEPAPRGTGGPGRGRPGLRGAA